MPELQHGESAPRTGGMNRREFVLTVLSGLLAGKVPAGSIDAQVPAWISRLAGDPNATAQLGASYLREHPAEHDAAYLADLLQKALTRHVDPTHAADARSLSTAAIAMINREYADAQVVEVDRWVLSVSEARLYALLTLTGGATP